MGRIYEFPIPCGRCDRHIPQSEERHVSERGEPVHEACCAPEGCEYDERHAFSVPELMQSVFQR